MGRRSYSGNAVPTVLSGGIGALDLTFTVQDATGYPTGASGPFYVTLARGAAGEEKVLCDSRSGLTFTVNAAGRGADGTVATSHAASSTTVEHTITKTDLDEANAHVNDTTGDPHPQYLTSAEGNSAYEPKGGRPIWVRPAELSVQSGAPSLGVVATRYVGWLLDATTDEAVAGTWDMPDGWLTAHLDVYWTNVGAGAGDVRWGLYTDQTADGAALGGLAGDELTVTAPAQNVLKVSRIVTGRAFTATSLQSMRVFRFGAAAADTLANDVALLGVQITKAS